MLNSSDESYMGHQDAAYVASRSISSQGHKDAVAL